MAVEHPPPPLPVVRVAEIPREDQPTRWLVDQLWGDSSVGLIGGAPKCSKTWLGLDLALSVATGTACLGKYAVPRPGPVLVYLAEDALPVLRQRVAGMARHRGLDLADVEMYVITAPTLRLDRDPHRSRLLETAKRRRPRLVLLDPLVRLHGIDENNAGEVAGLLAYFRALQRQLDLSVILVHHTRKNAAAGAAAGQGLRGSSDLHAFGDSNLYLRRTSHRLLLSSEHRAAPASPPVYLELIATDAQTTHLEVVAEVDGPKRASIQDQVLALLAGDVVQTRAALRDALGVKNQRLGEALESLEQAGQIRRTSTGWRRAECPKRRAVPVPRLEKQGNGTVLRDSSRGQDRPTGTARALCLESTSPSCVPRSRWSKCSIVSASSRSPAGATNSADHAPSTGHPGRGVGRSPSTCPIGDTTVTSATATATRWNYGPQSTICPSTRPR